MIADPDDGAASLLAAFDDVVSATGQVRDALVSVGHDAELLRRSAQQLKSTAQALRAVELEPGVPDVFAVHNPDPRYGVRNRGLVPLHTVTFDDGMQLRGSVSFERHFDGVGAVHGGAIAILFDDLMGRLANSAGRPMARTAFLHVDFRAPVSWGVPLAFTCGIASMDGRKRFLEGRLDRGGEVLSKANGLWVQLHAD